MFLALDRNVQSPKLERTQNEDDEVKDEVNELKWGWSVKWKHALFMLSLIGLKKSLEGRDLPWGMWPKELGEVWMGRLLKRDDNEGGDVIEMEKRHVVK